MGLERLAVACQDVDSLFDVDTVMNITHKVTEITGAHYGMSHEKDVSLRVITDHIRASVFMISDGVLRGAGDMTLFTVANLVNLGLRVVLAVTLAPRFGIQFVWMAVPVGWLVNYLISFFEYRTGRWRRAK